MTLRTADTASPQLGHAFGPAISRRPETSGLAPGSPPSARVASAPAARGPTSGLAPGSRRPTSSSCPRDALDFVRFCVRIRNRARCSRSPTPDRHFRPHSRPTPTCAPMCRATGCSATAQLVDEPTDVTRYWRATWWRSCWDARSRSNGRWPPPGCPLRINCRASTSRCTSPIAAAWTRDHSRGRWWCRCDRSSPADIAPRRGDLRPLPGHARRPGPRRGPRALGIADLDAPDFGDRVRIGPGEVPVFWACGVTPQAVAIEARPSLAIFHAPGHMFITDRPHIDFDLLEEEAA